MITTLSNVVLGDCTAQELQITKEHLAKRHISYDAGDTWLRIYDQRTPEQWASLLKEINMVISLRGW